MVPTPAELRMEALAWELVQSAARRQNIDLWDHTFAANLADLVEAIARDLQLDQALGTIDRS
jgi:hypothetical protein